MILIIIRLPSAQLPLQWLLIALLYIWLALSGRAVERRLLTLAQSLLLQYLNRRRWYQGGGPSYFAVTVVL